jgi:RHS repeat-associated protein
MESFYSQAFNFVSAVAGGVDPRTGLFNVNMPLVSLIGNDNLGPSLPLTLHYTALSTLNQGFGIGCSLGLSQYDTTAMLLTLSTGERYKVAETPSSVTLQQNRLDSIRFDKLVNANAYKITHKSGEVEWLMGPNQGGHIKVPLKLYTPIGHRLDLGWDFGSGVPRLSTVTDERGQLLFRATYAGSATTLQVWPGTAEAYEIYLIFQNSYLHRLEHHALAPALVWELNYKLVGSHNMLVSVTAPTGLIESVDYDDNVQKFPLGAPMPTGLPAVRCYTQTPQGGQPPIVITYDYSSYNYLGFGGSGGNWSANKDYLYGVLNSYRYWSRATNAGGENREVTIRSYNNFHLLTKEEVSEANCMTTTEIEYYAQEGTEFINQVPQFQLPKQTKVTYKNGNEAHREEVTQTAFDICGNPTIRITPDDVKTEWEYYPAAGSGGFGGAPREPNGFIRLMKSQTITPPNDLFPAPKQITTYAYSNLSTTVDSQGAVASPAIVLARVDITSGSESLSRRTMNYQITAASPELGRMTQIQEELNLSSTTSYKNFQDFTFTSQGNLLVQTSTHTTHDGHRTTSSQSQSCWSGRIASRIDEQGNTNDYCYDKLGRILSKTINRGKPDYVSQTQYAYSLENGMPLTTTTDPIGNQIRTWHDGMGRILRQAHKAQGAQGWQDITLHQYDARGRLQCATGKDVLQQDDRESEISVTQTFSYDSWNQNSLTTYSDGYKKSTIYDPVSMTAETQLTGTNQGKQVTRYNKQHLPAEITHYDSRNVAQGRVQYTYDGLGRLHTATDELERRTTYAYDAWGRLSSTTLPDGTVVRKSYAADSGGARLVTNIMLDNTSQGTQVFDGLGRLQSTQSGGRTYGFEYADDNMPVPIRITTPDSKTINYQYIAELGNAVKQVSVDSLRQIYTYNPKTGAMLTAEEVGSMQHTMRYTSLGWLQEETFIPAGGQPKSAEYTYSPNGLPQSYADVMNVMQTCTYDPQGRVTQLNDPDGVLVELYYDELSRLSGWTATDARTTKTLATTLAYDDFNRESKRELRCDGDTWTISQEYQLNGQLSKRKMQRDALTLRDEQYQYDNRNRLSVYSCSGDSASQPLDAYGKGIVTQRFTYDALSNITQCMTQFLGGSDTATYTYSSTDPSQLVAVGHTHSAYPQHVTLTYDTSGRLISDEAGRTLSYDALGRLVGVVGDNAVGGRYLYDGHNTLVAQVVKTGETRELYYRAGLLVNEMTRENSNRTRFIRVGGSCVAQRREGAQAGTALTGTDGKHSVLVTSQGGTKQEYAYSPYGYRRLQAIEDMTSLGFNGERPDPVSGTYHLGNGYREYNPVLMRFNTPDSWSPFGAGGINPYGYCAGDPINGSDPSGHLSWQAWLGIGMGVLGVVATVATFGMAAAPVIAAEGVAAGLVSGASAVGVVGGMGLAADVTAIASGAVEESNPGASSVLGWVSLGLGVPGMISGVTGLVGAARKIATNSRTGGEAVLTGFSKVADDAADIHGAEEAVHTPLRNTRAGDISAEMHLADTALHPRLHYAKMVPVTHAEDLNVLSESGKANKFVFTGDRKFVIGSIDKTSPPKWLSHPALAERGVGSGASSRVISAGYIDRDIMGRVRLSNVSGHYMPGVADLKPAQDYLSGIGVHASKTRVGGLGYFLVRAKGLFF